MKTLFSAVLFLSVLASCQEDEIKPISHVGFYSFESDDLQLSFEMIREHGIYKGTGVSVSHDAITGAEGRDNIFITRQRTETGYDQILIRSHVPVTWQVDLSGVHFTQEGMRVDEIRIMMPGQSETVRQNQVIRKLRL